ncbi:MAG: gamma-glutamylcyclotransferase family protein [Methylotetracoccus sp.]
MSRHVFAYGTLQLAAVMEAVTGRSFRSESAVLAGFERCRLIARSYPGLRRRPGATTIGRLYRQVDSRSMELLDRFEDSFYSRRTLFVAAGGEFGVPAEVYVIEPRYYRLLLPREWSVEQFARRRLADYLRRCRRGNSAA